MADPKKVPRRPAAGALQSDPPTRFAVQPTRFAPPTGPQPVPPASESLPSYGGGPPVVTGGYSPPDQETSPLANIGTPSIPPGYELARPPDSGPSSLSKILSIIGELTKGAATGSQYPNFLSAMGGSYGARQDELSQQAQLQRQQRMEDEQAEQTRLKSEADLRKIQSEMGRAARDEASQRETQIRQQRMEDQKFERDRLKGEADIRAVESGIGKTEEETLGARQQRGFGAEMQPTRLESQQLNLKLQKINIRLKEIEEELMPTLLNSEIYRNEADRKLAATNLAGKQMENELYGKLIAEGVPQKLARAQAEEMVQEARQAKTTADTQEEMMRLDMAIKESRAVTAQLNAETANLRAQTQADLAASGGVLPLDREARIHESYARASASATEPFKFMGESGKENAAQAQARVDEQFGPIFSDIAEARSLRRSGQLTGPPAPPTGPPAPMAGSGTEVLPGRAVKPQAAIPGRSSSRGDSLSIR